MAVSGINDNNPYAFLNSTSSTEEKNKDAGTLGMEDFMSLMTTQLKYQDPMNPMENGDFLGQIASFAQVTGLSDLQDSFSTFANSMQSNQALQGSSLVGRTVLIPSSIGNLTATDGLSGRINVADPVTDLKVKIYDEAGVVVRTIDMGAASGYTDFTWDGFDDNGEALPEGVYQFKASGTVDGSNTAFATGVLAQVSSVSISSTDGLIVNLAGIGSTSFSEVVEIL